MRKIDADREILRFVVANPKAYSRDSNDLDLRKLPNCGCNVELTRIFVDNDRSERQKAWYSVCLEAFGDPARTTEILKASAELFFKEFGLPPIIQLTENSSRSYPAWLSSLDKR